MKHVILSAGLGTRLKQYTTLHKALINIQNKPVISHIIDKIPLATQIVVIVGHQKEILCEYLNLAHKFRNIQIVVVDNPTIGPGYSLRQAQHLLQEPFIVQVVDCLFDEPIPTNKDNWMGVCSDISDKTAYYTVKIEQDIIVDSKNKAQDGYDHAYIGISQIIDYKSFWQNITDYEFTAGFKDIQFKPEYFTWYDTGNLTDLNNTKKRLNTYNISKKMNKETYIGSQIIKVYENPQENIHVNYALNRLRFVPPQTYGGKYVSAYKKLDAKTVYEWDSLSVFIDALSFIESNWGGVEQKDMRKLCREFYYNKSIERINKISFPFQEYTVNGTKCRPLNRLLQEINWDLIFEGKPGNTHGDLQFSNMLYDGNFWIINPRPDFAGEIMFGDIYYDLGKLYALCKLSWQIAVKNEYQLDSTNYSNITTPNLTRFVEYMEQKYAADLYKIKIIAGLAYLNMCPLYTGTISELLYYLGLELLEQTID